MDTSFRHPGLALALLAFARLIISMEYHIVLEQVEDAVTVPVRDSGLSATGDPFAETTEQLGGFLFIEATDLHEAIRIAGRLPAAWIDSIEVRPVADLIRERSRR